MSHQWDATLNEIAKKNADKWGIPTDQAKLLVDTYTSQNLKAMRRGEVVIWINIGKFFISPVRTGKWLLKLFRKWREGEFDKEALKERIVKYYPFHQNARKHDPRTGSHYRYQLAIKRARESGMDMKVFFKLNSYLARQRHNQL